MNDVARRRRVWLGGIGAGIETVCVAAAALGAPKAIWGVALFVGALLIAYAVLIGEDHSDSPLASTVASGGDGAGHVRGNVIGDNVTINVASNSAATSHATTKRLMRTTPADLTKIYREHTEVQANKLAEPYIGGQLRVVGTVADVTKGKWSVGYGVAIEVDGRTFAYASFNDAMQEHLPRLRRGESIEVVGRLAEFTANHVTLDQCDLVDSGEKAEPTA